MVGNTDMQLSLAEHEAYLRFWNVVIDIAVLRAYAAIAENELPVLKSFIGEAI
jgi:hypothetical protein